MSALWPITTPGRPAKVKPVTSKGQSLADLVQCRPIWYQTPGIDGARCGSLARIGAPVVVCVARRPTHALEPTPLADAEQLATAARVAEQRSQRPQRSRRTAVAGRLRQPGAVTRGVLLEDPVDDAALVDDRRGSGRRGTAGRARRSAPGSAAAIASARSTSSSMLPPRFQAIAFSQANESTAVQGSGV